MDACEGFYRCMQALHLLNSHRGHLAEAPVEQTHDDNTRAVTRERGELSEVPRMTTKVGASTVPAITALMECLASISM